MVNDAELATIIARKIFEIGSDGPGYEATRIQFMAGKYPDSERPMGGFGEQQLVNFIKRVLKEHRSY